MNRRHFLALFGSLPFVGVLFEGDGVETEIERFERMARSGLVKGEYFDFREYENVMLKVPPGCVVKQCNFQMPKSASFCPFESTDEKGAMVYIVQNIFDNRG